MSVYVFNHRLRLLPWVSLAGVATFLLGTVALHWLQPDLDPLDEAISYYVHGEQGWLLTLALLSLGLGSVALTVALAREPGVTPSRGGTWCLGLWSAGVLLGAVFAADPPGQWNRPPSVGGSIHGLAAMLALVIFPVATRLWTRRLRPNEHWSQFSSTLLVLSWASAASLVAFGASLVPVFVRPGPPILLGLTERILFAFYVSWLVVAAVGLSRLPRRPTTQPGSPRHGDTATPARLQ